WENNNRTQEVISEALVSTGVDAFQAEVAAGSVLGALTAALMYWARNEGEDLQACVGLALQQIAGRT
ncbi:MAG: TetR family transcriptional regulator, partial [Acidimicrobiia bacterium]|nr:TetR family transcriptional regulator [Acidimicrobiia bacterium]